MNAKPQYKRRCAKPYRVRLSNDYGKAGSFEGFCSGGELAQSGYMKALEKAQSGKYPAFLKKGMTAAE